MSPRNVMTLLLVVGSALSLAGCGRDGSESQTPRLQSSARGDARALLTTAELRSIPGMPGDIEAVSLDGVNLYENPDPRGPCGAKIKTPRLSLGRGIGLRAASVTGTQYVFDLPLAEAKAYLDRLIADTRVGCAPHRSRTNTGSIQEVRMTRVLSLGPLVDQQNGSAMVITDRGRTLHGAQISLRSSHRVQRSFCSEGCQTTRCGRWRHVSRSAYARRDS